MVGFRSYSLKVTPLRSVVIVEVELSQDEPLSVDLRITPEEPTATNVLFPKVTPLRWVEIPELRIIPSRTIVRRSQDHS